MAIRGLIPRFQRVFWTASFGDSHSNTFTSSVPCSKVPRKKRTGIPPASRCLWYYRPHGVRLFSIAVCVVLMPDPIAFKLSERFPEVRRVVLRFQCCPCSGLICCCWTRCVAYQRSCVPTNVEVLTTAYQSFGYRSALCFCYQTVFLLTTDSIGSRCSHERTAGMEWRGHSDLSRRTVYNYCFE